MNRSSTPQLKRWRVYCSTESVYIDVYKETTSNISIVCPNNNTHTIDSSKTSLIEIINNDFTESVNKWKITCDTESIDVNVWLPGYITTPTVCPNNNSHTISTTQKLETVYNCETKIRELAKPVEGFIRIESIEVLLEPNETKSHDLVWKFPICPLTVTILAKSKNIGDVFTVDVSPNRIVGAITSNVSIGDTVIHVSPTVLQYAHIGFPCTLYNGTNTCDIGFIISKDYINGTVTMSTTANMAFLAATPTYFRISVRFMGPHIISGTGPLALGSGKIGASYIPANEIVRATLVNNSDLKKTIRFLVEYIY